MKEKKKKLISMEKLTEGYEEFTKKKEVLKNGKEVFDKTLKNSAKPKDKI